MVKKRNGKSSVKPNSGMHMSCGEMDSCSKMHLIVKGAILLFLGILLWAKIFDLRIVIALLLVIMGIKHIAWGFHL